MDHGSETMLEIPTSSVGPSGADPAQHNGPACSRGDTSFRYGLRASIGPCCFKQQGPVTHKQRLPTFEREMEVPARSKADVPPDASNADDDASSTNKRTGRAQAKRLRVSQRRRWLVEAQVAASAGGLTHLLGAQIGSTSHPQQLPEGDSHLRGLCAPKKSMPRSDARRDDLKSSGC